MASKAFLVLLSALAASCSSLQDLSTLWRNDTVTMNSKTIYRHDMSIVVNGHVGGSSGVLVVPKAEVYTIEIEAKEKLDLFTLRSCHREIPVENIQGKGGGIFGNKHKSVKIDYKPTEIEKADCPLELTGYSKASGKHSFAFIDFENDGDKLPALLRCNGAETNTRGVSVCSARYSLYQEISFAEQVMVWPDTGCPLGEFTEKTEGGWFLFPIVKGHCTYIFEGVKSHETHRLTTIGYEEIIVRGGE